MLKHLYSGTAFCSILACLSIATQASSYDIQPDIDPNSGISTTIYDWQGAYTGLTFGIGKGTSHQDFTPETTTGSFGTGGIIGGITGGYNLQLSSFLVGLEADFSGSGIGGQTTCPSTNYSCHTDSKWLATIRPRFGIPFGQILPYMTGGLAADNVHIYNRNPSSLAGSNFNDTQVGWTVGGGLEVAVYRNWTFKAEYLYVKFDSTDGPSSAGFPTVVKFDESICRIGLNYKFN